MNKSYPDLAHAMGQMLDQLDAMLDGSGYQGTPIQMILAGGMAMNFWCGSRYTHDIDATFSKRLILSEQDSYVDYIRQDGEADSLYFDRQFNPSLTLLHADYDKEAVEWRGMGNEHRNVHLYVLNPVDLAVSKLSRFHDQDREDIKQLAADGLITAKQVEKRALEAIHDYVGNVDRLKSYLRLSLQDIQSVNSRTNTAVKKAPEKDQGRTR